jgi:hypothetical protein
MPLYLLQVAYTSEGWASLLKTLRTASMQCVPL